MKTVLFTPHVTLENYFNKVLDKTLLIHNIDALNIFLKKNTTALLLYHNRNQESALKDISQLIKDFPQLSILLLDDAPSYLQGTHYLKLGIKGYGNTLMDPQNIQQALDVIRAGNIWLYPAFMQELITKVSAPKEKVRNQHLQELSPAQLEVAKLVSEGKSNKEVAIAKGITERTVKAHLSAIYTKLNIGDRLSLALIFK